MKQIYIFFSIFFIFSHVLASTHQVYILPQEKMQALKAINKELKHAKKDVKIAIYNFTHKKIANTLKNIAKKGVKVKIIFDYESSNKRKDRSMLYYLAKYKNIDVYQLRGKYVKKKDYFGKMHQKIAIIDDKVLILGSANWSYSAFGKNYEIVLIEKDKKIVKKVSKAFEELLKKAKKF